MWIENSKWAKSIPIYIFIQLIIFAEKKISILCFILIQEGFKNIGIIPSESILKISLIII